MSNDDLGQFPQPSQPQAPAEPVNPQSSVPTEPDTNAPVYHDPFSSPTDNTAKLQIPTPVIARNDSDAAIPEPLVTPAVTSTAPTSPFTQFEETPEEIPSVQPSFSQTGTAQTPEYNPPAESTTPIVEPTPEPVFTPKPETPITPAPTPTPAPIMATSLPKNSPSLAPIIFVGLLIIAGIGLAMSVFLFSQSAQLKKQLADITQTLNSQKTIITPTPTPTPIEVATPSLTPIPTPTATPSGILNPTPTPINSATPLLYAQQALKVALNRQQNAQMILIKVENASDPTTSVIKYFFRQDLTTKKYFYVTILDKGEPAIIDKAIYVTPDNNIPSLNEAIVGNTFGMDLDKALQIAYDACTSDLCKTANLKAQFIKSNDTFIWQLAFTPADTTQDVLIIQINSINQDILYKSPGF